MPERQPPRVVDDSPIGPDVDLERDDIRLADGTRLTPDIADPRMFGAFDLPAQISPGNFRRAR